MSSPNKTTFSFEIFPPKPTSEPSIIYGTLDALQDLKPDFISVTYGAGGGANCKNTVGIASYIQNTCQTESVAHLPCLYLSESDLNGILEQLRVRLISQQRHRQAVPLPQRRLQNSPMPTN